MSAIAKVSVRPVVAPRSFAVAAKPARAARVVVYSTPKPEAIEQAIQEAKDACDGGSSGECAAAWDTVEELSAAASHAKAQTASTDPLEEQRLAFCEEDPSADECRVYDD